jgi:hypothetical protein
MITSKPPNRQRVAFPVERLVGLDAALHGTSLTVADFDGYFCVFVGSPKLYLPYCLFASRPQAKLFRDEIGNRYPLLTLRKWKDQFVGK